MADAATPARSQVSGPRGHGAQAWEGGKRLRLHSCDWPQPPGGAAAMISHVQAGGGGTTALIAKHNERARGACDRNDQGSVKEQ